MPRRFSMRLPPEEDALLRHLYLSLGIPTDQYSRRPEELEALLRQWNRLSGRKDLAGEVLHYMVTRRKRGLWERFDGAHKRLASMPSDLLTEEQWTVLRAIYEELVLARGHATDALNYDDALGDQVAATFAKNAGRVLPGRLLFAAMMAKRKRADWPKLGQSPPSPDIGFGDIDEVAG